MMVAMLSRIALTVCLAAASACGPTIDTSIEDAALTAAVKTALLNSTEIDGTLVSVTCRSGVVQLGGWQPSPEAAETALKIVRGVAGVVDVQSTIEIRPSTADHP
jgi:osmotically-inducible protein OsmY